MSAQPAARPDYDQPDRASDPIAADMQYYRDVLQKILDIGVALVEQLPATPANPQPTTDAVVAYERLTRAIRRTVFLATTLDQPPPAPRAAPAQPRERFIREAEDLIPPGCRNETDVEDVRENLRERLDRPDFKEDIMTREIGDVIAEICRDLGMAAIPTTHPWARRTPADIAELCARAAAHAPSIPPEPDPDDVPETHLSSPTRFREK